jgi:hypothetical protein
VIDRLVTGTTADEEGRGIRAEIIHHDGAGAHAACLAVIGEHEAVEEFVGALERVVDDLFGRSWRSSWELRHGISRTSELGTGACFDLHKGERLTMPCDDVHFTTMQAVVVPVKHTSAMLAEMLRREVLAEQSDLHRTHTDAEQMQRQPLVERDEA